MEGRYLNNQVAQIVGITNRQVISWTEKGLVVPYEESTGVGKKRIYDYVNLLEFSISTILLDNFGMGFRAVKKIVKHLRKQGSLTAWATNFNEYYESEFNKCRVFLEEWLKSTSVNDEKYLKIKKSYDDFLSHGIQPKSSAGVLAYFKGLELEELHVIPWEIENAVNLNIIKEGFNNNIIGMLIDLGKIKNIIDKRI